MIRHNTTPAAPTAAKHTDATSPSTSTEADTTTESSTTDSSSLFPLEYVTALKAENIRRVTEGRA